MLIKIKVFTNSKKQEIVEKENKKIAQEGSGNVSFAYILEAYVKAKPQEGKANQEVLLLLSQYLKTPLKNLRIIKGQTSPHKIIKVCSA